MDEAAFALINICVRNDNHCPTCRRYFVTFYKTWEEAKDDASSEIRQEWRGEGECNKEQLDELCKESRCWVDEWVRRSNGDWYIICPVSSGTQWNLRHPDEIAAGKQPITDGLPAKFLALRIAINKNDWCPDNISFHVTPFHTVEAAIEYLNVTSNYEHNDPYEEIELSAVWRGNSEKGEHLQVIPMPALGERIELNSFCPQIQEKEWHK